MSVNIISVSVAVFSVSAPTDEVHVAVCADSGGVPGSELGGFDLASPSGFCTPTDPAVGGFTEGDKFWIALSRTGALNNYAFYAAALTTAAPPGIGGQFGDDGTGWADLEAPYGVAAIIEFDNGATLNASWNGVRNDFGGVGTVFDPHWQKLACAYEVPSPFLGKKKFYAQVI